MQWNFLSDIPTLVICLLAYVSIESMNMENHGEYANKSSQAADSIETVQVLTFLWFSCEMSHTGSRI